MRNLALPTVLVAAAALMASTASATRPTLHVRPSVVAPGGLVHVSGNADGCPRGDTVFVISRAFPGRGFAGIGVIKATVRAGGYFSGSGHVRRRAHGRYGVTARCGGGNFGVIVYLRVR